MQTHRTHRKIGDTLRWSPQCREHFFPWLAKGANVLQAHAISEAGITECHPGYCLERSAPRFHLLVYPTKGSGEVFDAVRSKRIEPGQVLITPAGKAFGYAPVTRTWRFMWFHLPDDPVWAFLHAEKFTIRKTPLTDTLRRVTEEFLRESRGRTDSHHEASELYISLIALYIKRELGERDAAAGVAAENQLDHLCEIINADLTRDWNVESLAAALNVSCSHLHRLVRGRFNTSPMKLVTRLRMERAQEWLIMHDAPQSFIGKMVGYSNEFAFLVAFKRFSGVTPKEFRTRR